MSSIYLGLAILSEASNSDNLLSADALQVDYETPIVSITSLDEHSIPSHLHTCYDLLINPVIQATSYRQQTTALRVTDTPLLPFQYSCIHMCLSFGWDL